MSSVMGLIRLPKLALYSSTKHALEGYSESLDHELRAFGIRVVLVEPAYTRTLFEDNLTTPDRLLDVYDLARAGAKAVMREAMQQVGDVPEVVAETVLKAATAAVPRRRYAAGKKGTPNQFPAAFRARSCVLGQEFLAQTEYAAAAYGERNLVSEGRSRARHPTVRFWHWADIGARTLGLSPLRGKNGHP